MSELSGTWLGIAVGGAIVIAVFLCKRGSISNEAEGLGHSETKGPIGKQVKAMPIQEKIRQIALIEKDEFDRFYQPLIEKVLQYMTAIGAAVDQHYFETVYKALRKRRAVIFEHGASERDQKNKALWTIALFSAISIRFIVTQCQANSIRVNGETINPFLVSLETLATSDVQRHQSESRFQPGISRLHLIDKLLEPDLIAQFERAGIYGFVINAVTGYYHERLNPFYSIIEQVEAHMVGVEPSEEANFKQTMKMVLTLIERNTFTKNTQHSFVFEGMSSLLIDRNFLWELYRNYVVASTQPFGKKDFEATLNKVYHLGSRLEKNSIFTFPLEEGNLDESQEKFALELRNMVALPYKAVPYYRFTDRKKIKKRVLQRDIVNSDVSRDSFEDQNGNSSLDNNKSRSRAQHFLEGTSDSVGLEDLFS